MKKEFILFVSIIFSLNTYSQLHQGEWRDHLTYTKGNRVAVMGDLVYCTTYFGLLSYDKNTREVKKHSKVTGLSDVEVSTIEYSKNDNVLIIGYKNGNIDLILPDGTIKNLSDIKRKVMVGTKTINRIVINDHFAYLACDFGIVAVDLVKQEIKDSYLFGSGGGPIKVNDLTIGNESIYAATDFGVYIASLNSSNLVDYSFWKLIEFLPQFNLSYKFIEYFNNKIYAVFTELSSQADRIVMVGPNTFENSSLVHDDTITDLSSSNGNLAISGKDQTYIFNQQESLVLSFSLPQNNHTYIDLDQVVYTASLSNGFGFQSGNNNINLSVNGPRFSKASKVASMNDQVWVSSGSPENAFDHGGCYNFSNNQWTSYTSFWGFPFAIGNTFKFAIDPHDNLHVFATAYRYGLLEFENREFKHYFNKENTSVFSDIPTVVDVRISGIQFDQQNNLWMILDLVTRPLVMLSSNGTWERPSNLTNPIFQAGNGQFTDLLVTKTGQIWISTKFGSIIVLEENSAGDLTENPSFLVKNDAGDLKSRTFCLEEDLDGNIWVGTNSGPVIYNPSHLFDNSDIIGQQYRVPRNDGTNNADFFLAGEAILEIATDGGNRKWLTTEKSGVYLVTADGKKVLNNFRETNSPLLSNNVPGVGINQKNGEVFFATSLGLVSYMGISTLGNEDFTDVYVFPNPVRPNYEGNITITGLIENTLVKITDVSGNLVFETKSLGGQAVWDGLNFNRQRVATGVYLVFLSSEDGQKTFMTKLAFIH